MTTRPNNLRAPSLDALRGLAILGMVLSGYITHGGILPAWMHHAQVPPPEHVFDPNLPGISWVDLVFPMFLFAMGMAFPFSIRRRLLAGSTHFQLILAFFRRWMFLFVFALFFQHIKPHSLDPQPGALEYGLALLGFLLFFPIFGTHPRLREWKFEPYLSWAGLGVAALYLFLLPGQPAEGDAVYFSLQRTDIIILILSNVAFFGALAWLFTRDHILPRLLILAVLLGLRLSHQEGGYWVSVLWDISPAPWFFRFTFLQYLHITLAGSIVGDLAYGYYRKIQSPETTQVLVVPNEKYRFVFAAVLMLLTLGLSIAGLFARWGFLLIFLQAAMLLGAWLLLRGTVSLTGAFLRQALVWGIAFLLIGMCFEPFEGGIKKDHATVSYYYVTAGLSTFLFLCFFILLELFHARGWSWLKDTGKNPMIAYVAPAVLILPVLSLLGLTPLLNEWMDGLPLTAFLKGVVITALAVLATVFFTRLGWRWKT